MIACEITFKQEILFIKYPTENYHNFTVKDCFYFDKKRRSGKVCKNKLNLRELFNSLQKFCELWALETFYFCSSDSKR